MKIGLIRCLETETECGGGHCFQTIENQEGAFKEINETIELIGVASCGGCPGDKVRKRVELISKGGAEAVVLGSCIKMGTPIGFSCPNVAKIKRQIKEVDPEMEIIDWTHHENFTEILLDRVKTTNLSNLGRFFTSGVKL
ncbi:MAG: CGGC domain-containing protein [Halanaerobacter sp.]